MECDSIRRRARAKDKVYFLAMDRGLQSAARFCPRDLRARVDSLCRRPVERRNGRSGLGTHRTVHYLSRIGDHRDVSLEVRPAAISAGGSEANAHPCGQRYRGRDGLVSLGSCSFGSRMANLDRTVWF